MRRNTGSLRAGLAVLLGVQWYLYGHPLASGYADMGALFSIDRVGVNARQPWLLDLARAGSGVSGFVSGRRAILPTIRAPLAIVIATITLPYLAYRTFDHWETLRFLLPALAMLTIPAAAGLLAVTRRVAGARGGALLSALVVLVLAHSWNGWLRANNVFTMPDHETRLPARRRAGRCRRRRRMPWSWRSCTAAASATTRAARRSAGIGFPRRDRRRRWRHSAARAMPFIC